MIEQTIVVLVALVTTGCFSAGLQNKFREYLGCGLTVEDVREIAESSRVSRFSCYDPGGGLYTCSAAWGLRGYDCEFDSKGGLVAYRHVKLRPLTEVIVSETVMLCIAPSWHR